MATMIEPGEARAARGAEPARVTPAARLRGSLSLPGDKSISHRALLLAAIADGTSRIRHAGDGDDVRTTARLVGALGPEVARYDGADGRSAEYVVTSPGAEGLAEPADVLDCGNSGTSLRLLAGILAARPGLAVLTGDASLRARPVARIVDPLREMGASVVARRDDALPPLAIRGRAPLRAIDHTPGVPSAQVKSAILLAGLGAEGTTTVSERVATRDHTERMLRARGVRVVTEATAHGGTCVSIDGGQRVDAANTDVPGDVSAAAFWLVAASIHPDAELRIAGVGLNPSRTAVVEILRAMGADLDVRSDAVAAGGAAAGEPRGDVLVRSASLRAVDLAPADVARAIDEVPVLCLAATQAAGTTTIRGVGELRTKESDRVEGIALGLAAFGGRVEVAGDDVRITGPTPLSGAVVDARLDHRLAMTFAVAGLVARGETRIAGASSASVSYPGFFDDLGSVQA